MAGQPTGAPCLICGSLDTQQVLIRSGLPKRPVHNVWLCKKHRADDMLPSVLEHLEANP